MDGSVQELINKAGKMALEAEMPKYSTNWCDIPMEMRAECIKRMDFRTKTRLGATSHTEKTLVDRKKHSFDFVFLKLEPRYCPPFFHCFVCKTQCNDGQSEAFLITSKKMYKCVRPILKNCEIDDFTVDAYDWDGTEPCDMYDSDNQELWTEIEKCAPFRFKKLTFLGRRFNDSLQMLLNNIEDVEEIRIPFAKSSFTKLMSIPAVRNTKLLEILLHPDPDDIHSAVQKWIDEDSDIGKQYIFRVQCDVLSILESFDDKFKNRVIYKKDEEIRIRTDNESKHILLRDEGCYYSYTMRYEPERYSFTVIPSNLLESEYKKLDVRY